MELQERQVRKRLKSDFEPLIDMSDYLKHSLEEQDKARCSRALAAMTVAANAKLSVEESCAAVVDESGDEGIDAVGLAVSRGEVYIVQSKTSPGGPSPTEVTKFIEGIRLLLDWNWDELGGKLRQRRSEIEAAMEGDVRVIAIYSHLGSQEPNDKAKRLRDQFLQNINSSGDILEFRFEGLRENFEHRNIASGLGSPDFDLTFDRWLTMGDYKSNLMGVVAGSELAELVSSFQERVFDKNIRSVLRSSETNDIMDSTLKESPGEFWYYNNGITIVANAITCGRPSPRSQNETFSLQGLSVVNGAQTCGALARVARNGASLDDVKVTVRVISTSGREGDFDKKVTRYTNTQNQIISREFVSLDPYQQELADMLLAEGIQYRFRTGHADDDEGVRDSFDLEDATKALACFSGVLNATRAKREIGRMWSDLNSTPYLDIFPRNLDAFVMYNSVCFWRSFNEALKVSADGMESRDARILENSAYVSCALFMRFAKSKGVKFDSPDFNSAEWHSEYKMELDNLFTCVVTRHEEDNPGGYPMSFFKNLQKVNDFADGVWKNFFTSSTSAGLAG